jgi:hypothetical protein
LATKLSKAEKGEEKKETNEKARRVYHQLACGELKRKPKSTSAQNGLSTSRKDRSSIFCLFFLPPFYLKMTKKQKQNSHRNCLRSFQAI